MKTLVDKWQGHDYALLRGLPDDDADEFEAWLEQRHEDESQLEDEQCAR